MKLKPVPLGAICEMVRAEPPELVSVWDRVLLLAAATFPKLRERFPLRLPLDGGVNLTVKVVLWPALRLIGRRRPVTPNPAPATVA